MATPAERKTMIDKIRNLPAQLEAAVRGLNEADLTTPYLDGEWAVAQIVHHVADSHMNAYIRHKLIVYEDRPALKPYNQEDWAKSPDANNSSIQDSLTILKGLHARWVTLLDSLKDEDWKRTGIHPEYGETSLDDQLTIYSGHGQNHIDQIKKVLAAKGGR